MRKEKSKQKRKVKIKLPSGKKTQIAVPQKGHVPLKPKETFSKNQVKEVKTQYKKLFDEEPTLMMKGDAIQLVEVFDKSNFFEITSGSKNNIAENFQDEIKNTKKLIKSLSANQLRVLRHVINHGDACFDVTTHDISDPEGFIGDFDFWSVAYELRDKGLLKYYVDWSYSDPVAMFKLSKVVSLFEDLIPEND